MDTADALTAACGGWLGVTRGPRSFPRPVRARHRRRPRAAADASVVTEPIWRDARSPVQRYLRAVGVVGQPKVLNYRLRFRGRIRGAPTPAGCRSKPIS